MKLRSVWNWRKQFSESDIALFKNPLYQLDDLVDPRSPMPSSCNVLPNHEVYFLEPWAQCYFRWLPALGIRQGGRPQVDLIHRWLRRSIDASLTELRELSKRPPMELARNRSASRRDGTLTLRRVLDENGTSDSFLLEQSVDNFFPFSNCDDSAFSLADSSTLSEFDSQSVLNLTD